MDEPVARLRAALDALHPSARYVRVEAIDLEAALAARSEPGSEGLRPVIEALPEYTDPKPAP